MPRVLQVGAIDISQVRESGYGTASVGRAAHGLRLGKGRMDKVGPLSPMALIASFGYLGACLAAFVAAFVAFARARHRRQVPNPMHREGKAWTVIGSSFAVFLFMRVLQIEDRLRGAGRAWIMQDHAYSRRWDWQAPAAAFAVVLIFTTLLLVRFRRMQRGTLQAQWPRTLQLAFVAVGAMIVLIVFRLVSLHSIDSVLYRGPHLNWVVDTASTVMVIITGFVSVAKKPTVERPDVRSRRR